MVVHNIPGIPIQGDIIIDEELIGRISVVYPFFRPSEQKLKRDKYFMIQKELVDWISVVYPFFRLADFILHGTPLWEAKTSDRLGEIVHYSIVEI